MKSLKTIQVLAKVGRILSKIIFIFCIVGFCAGVVAIISLALGIEEFKYGGVTIRSVIENKAGLSTPALYAQIAVGMVLCAAEVLLAKYAELYFKNELQDGTPFTLRGANELKRLGILTIVIPIIASIVCAIGVGIVKRLYPDIALKDIPGGVSIGLGIMMLVTSLFCRYGAELREGKIEEPADVE